MNKDKIYTIDEIRTIINDNKDYFEERFFVDKFFLFGSYAKNLQNADSDIDLLVKFKKTVDMFDFIDLQDYLSRLFEKKIDLGTSNGLKDFIKEKILKEAILL
ncbi:nucleotidyltransferase family protein [bacterium]|nr:nucleotidyltransferase family protein [bacterium]